MNRELDAWIAQYVMEIQGVMIDPTDGEALYRASPPMLGWNFVPNYSSDISAAFKVVEKLSYEGAIVIIKSDGLRKIGAPRYTIIINNERVDHDNLPMAICLAVKTYHINNSGYTV